MWVTAQSRVHHRETQSGNRRPRAENVYARGKLWNEAISLRQRAAILQRQPKLPRRKESLAQSRRSRTTTRARSPCCSSSALSVAAFAPRKGLRMLNAMTRRPAISDDSEPSWEAPVGDFAGTPELSPWVSPIIEALLREAAANVAVARSRRIVSVLHDERAAPRGDGDSLGGDEAATQPVLARGRDQTRRVPLPVAS